jgi:hypothetical protein
MKGNIMPKHIKNTPLVRIAATVKLLPTALSEIPKGIKEKREAFADQVKQEIDQRRTMVNMITD